MPSENAIIQDVMTVRPFMVVEEALEYLEDRNVRAMPVVDDQNRLIGVFSLSLLLKSLLPVSVTMEDGLQQLDFVIGAGPGVAKRMRKVKKQKVEEVMAKENIMVVHPATPIWEAIRMIAKYGSPLPVVEEDTGVLNGIISEQSALNDLHRILEELEKEDNL